MELIKLAAAAVLIKQSSIFRSRESNLARSLGIPRENVIKEEFDFLTALLGEGDIERYSSKTHKGAKKNIEAIRAALPRITDEAYAKWDIDQKEALEYFKNRFGDKWDKDHEDYQEPLSKEDFKKLMKKVQISANKDGFDIYADIIPQELFGGSHWPTILLDKLLNLKDVHMTG